MVWQLGVVPYLNADPLAAALREPGASMLVGDSVQVRSMVPSDLVRILLDGALDAALVSTAGALPYPSLRILPGMCIASRGPVQSILLFCRKPLAEVKSVALDASSRSAVALARLLFAEHWRTTPDFRTLPPDLPSMLDCAEAALLIGNPALLARQALRLGLWKGPPLECYDLGAEWADLTGMPFVYAVWVAPADRDTERLTAALLRAKAWGLRRVRALAARGAAGLGLAPETAERYLTEAIHYDLGPEEMAGMDRFCRLAVRHGILPEGSAVRFAEREPLGALGGG